MKKCFFLVILLSVFVFVAKAHAQGNAPVNWFASIAERQIPVIRERIRSNMTASERSIDRTIRFRVVRSEVNNARAFVDPNSDERIVEIYVGIVQAIDAIAEARAYASLEDDTSLVGDWLIYVAEEIDRRLEDPVNARDMGIVQRFPAFAGMSEENWQNFRANPAAQNQIEMEVNSSLMWLIGHEIAHHLRSHRRTFSLSDSRVQEEEADDIARRLMTSTGYSPYFASPVLLSFALWNPEAHLNERLSSHPAPLKRMKRNIEAGAKQLLSDPQFAAYLDSTGQRSRFEQAVDSDLRTINNIMMPSWTVQ